MRLADITKQLQLVLPKYTDYFSEVVNFDSIIAVAGVGTISAPGHTIVDGEAVTISNVSQETSILTVLKDGNIYTFETSVNHDLTLGYPGYETVTLGGFTDANWNSDFKLVGVPNRKTFQIQSALTIPTLSGSEFLFEIRIDGVNGRYPISVIDPNTLQISGSFADGSYLSGTIKQGVRIAGSVTIDRTLEEYTKQEINDMWAFISMSDVKASKDRNAYSDVTASFANGEDPRLRLMDGFSVYLIGSAIGEIAGVDILDIFRHDLLSPLLKSLSGVKFDTGLATEGDFKTILIGHNLVLYNRAYLVYQYVFQFSSDVTLDDQSDEADTRAFSEINYSLSIGGDDTTNMDFDTELPT